MKQFLEIAFVLALGLLVGGALSFASIRNTNQLAALTLGQWTAWPKAGGVDADPYTKARVAAEGAVPLGAAEGIAFHGSSDDSGRPLRLECTYRIAGQTPQARFWTLTAERANGRAIRRANGEAATLISRDILRRRSGDFELLASATLQSGNWLELAGSGEFALVFRLYDTQIGTASGLFEPSMPSLTLMGCSR